MNRRDMRTRTDTPQNFARAEQSPGYISLYMQLTLDERMDALEKQVAALTVGLAVEPPRGKDWHATFGLSKDDPEFDEMIRLGRLYRTAAGSNEGCAHP